MAEIPKKKGRVLKSFDSDQITKSEAYIKQIDELYNQAIKDYAKIAGGLSVDPSKPFAFKDYAGTKSKSDEILRSLSSEITTRIMKGTKDQWLFASDKNDAFLDSILDTSKIDKKVLAKYQDRNLDALSTFQSRKTAGLGLSDKIWNYSGMMKDQMEMGIDIALGDGRSAKELAKDLKQYLVDPDKLFRRVRDKHGVLHLSKKAAAYHPGKGKYRSSYKNSLRLARTEINMAYRESDQLRWKQLGFVVGFEVVLSNNHPIYDICDEVKGKYPKEFLFVGWHPQCRCKAIPILQDPKEFDTDELNELKAAINGTEYEQFQSKNEISDVPKGFKDWVSQNAERSKGWKSQPYFIRDNFVGGKIENGLKSTAETIKKIAAEKLAAKLAKKEADLLAIKLAAEAEALAIKLAAEAEAAAVAKAQIMRLEAETDEMKALRLKLKDLSAETRLELGDRPDRTIYRDFETTSISGELTTEQLKDRFGKPIYLKNITKRAQEFMPDDLQGHIRDLGKSAIEKDTASKVVSKINVDKLSFAQEFVFEKPIIRSDQKAISVINYKGKNYVVDGNHSLSRQILSGKKDITAKITFIDNEGNIIARAALDEKKLSRIAYAKKKIIEAESLGISGKNLDGLKLAILDDNLTAAQINGRTRKLIKEIESAKAPLTIAEDPLSREALLKTFSEKEVDSLFRAYDTKISEISRMSVDAKISKLEVEIDWIPAHSKYSTSDTMLAMYKRDAEILKASARFERIADEGKLILSRYESYIEADVKASVSKLKALLKEGVLDPEKIDNAIFQVEKIAKKYDEGKLILSRYEGYVEADVKASVAKLKALLKEGVLDPKKIDSAISEVEKVAKKYKEIRTAGLPQTLVNQEKTVQKWIDINRGRASASDVAAAEKYMKELIENGDFAMRFNAKDIVGIMDKGFLNQIELRELGLNVTSGGMNNPSARIKASQTLFGTDIKKANAFDYERYGYLADKDMMLELENYGPSSYGKTIAYMKKSTVQTTFTMVDSLGSGLAPSLTAAPRISSVSMSSVDRLLTASREVGSKSVNKATRKFSTSYIELQYHGAVDISNIEKILISRNEWEAGSFTPSIVQKLKKLGIKLFRQTRDGIEAI